MQSASYVGEPIVMVIADSRALAEDAAELVEVHYTPETAVVEIEITLATAEHLVHPGEETNVAASRDGRVRRDRCDPHVRPARVHRADRPASLRPLTDEACAGSSPVGSRHRGP